MMPRNKDGQVLERPGKHGRRYYALRVFAYGERHYVSLGSEHDGWTRAKAETELANIAADVRRGTWEPPARRGTKPRAQDPEAGDGPRGVTFHVFASDYLLGRRGEVSENMYRFVEWALTLHLLPYFAQTLVEDFTIELVDEYRRFKVQEAEQIRLAAQRGKPKTNRSGRPRHPLSARSINKTIDVLASILEVAVEYGRLPRNPASGRRRRLKAQAKRPVFLDTAAQITALLDAARILDRRTDRRMKDRRASNAMLVLAGPRADEFTRILWRDVDLANARVEIGRSKTQAGLREIHMLPLLRDELAAHKAAAAKTGPDDLVFPNSTGGRRDKDNVRNRVLEPVLAIADELLLDRGETPLPAGVTPHKLRHTFASILVACGEDPASVMAQLGHTDPRFTLKVYTHLMRRDPAERARLKALVYGEQTKTAEPALQEA